MSQAPYLATPDKKALADQLKKLAKKENVLKYIDLSNRVKRLKDDKTDAGIQAYRLAKEQVEKLSHTREVERWKEARDTAARAEKSGQSSSKQPSISDTETTDSDIDKGMFKMELGPKSDLGPKIPRGQRKKRETPADDADKKRAKNKDRESQSTSVKVNAGVRPKRDPTPPPSKPINIPHSRHTQDRSRRRKGNASSQDDESSSSRLESTS